MPAFAQFPEALCVRDVSIRPATVLAPMAGVTDTVFRQFIRGLGGCGLLMTEFTSSNGISAALKNPRGNKTLRYLYFEADERPITAQLFGADPQVMADAARVVEDLGFDIVDLNFGCPVKKVVRCNGGSGLLRDLPLVERILRAVRAAVKMPFTIKLRSGWDEQEIVDTQMARMAEDCGVEALALHPRTREQGFGGRSDWTRIAAVKDSVKIPVIGNGDIQTPEDAARMVTETGCDGVMIGRAASSNPWIFRQIEQHLAARRYEQPSEADRYAMIRSYYQMLLDQDDRNDAETAGKMKQFASYFTHGVRNGARLRADIYHTHTPGEIYDCVERFFAASLGQSGEAAHANAANEAREAPPAAVPAGVR